MDDGQPQLAHEVDPLGPAVEHRLGADVDRDPAHLGTPELAADLGRTLQQQYVVVGAEQVGGGQPGDAAADDHDRAHDRTVTIRSPTEPVGWPDPSEHHDHHSSPSLVHRCSARRGRAADPGRVLRQPTATTPVGSTAELGGPTAGRERGTAAQRIRRRRRRRGGHRRRTGPTADVSSGGVRGVRSRCPSWTQERSVISTAVVSVRSDDATRTRTEVMRIVDVHRGQVSDEETSTDESGQVQLSRLVLRIPASDFAETVGELEKVGELASSDKSSEDVSFDVIDTRARIRAQEQSLRRVELLLERARVDPRRRQHRVGADPAPGRARGAEVQAGLPERPDVVRHHHRLRRAEGRAREDRAKPEHRRVRLPGGPRRRLDGAGGLRDRAGHHRGRPAAVAGGARDPGLADLAAGPPIRPPSPGRPRCADGGCARMNAWMSSLPPSPY